MSLLFRLGYWFWRAWIVSLIFIIILIIPGIISTFGGPVFWILGTIPISILILVFTALTIIRTILYPFIKYKIKDTNNLLFSYFMTMVYYQWYIDKIKN